MKLASKYSLYLPLILGIAMPSLSHSAEVEVDVVDGDTINFKFYDLGLPSPQPNGGPSIIYISLPSSSLAGDVTISGDATFGGQAVNSVSTGSFAKPYDFPIALSVPSNLAISDVLTGTLTVDFNAPHGVSQSQFDGAGVDVNWGRFWVGGATSWAANTIGTAISGDITILSVANAPTSLVATAGDGQVSVAFTAPTDNGGSAITDYDYQLDGGSWVSAGTTSSPIVITGLTNGTSYSIKLRAVNAAGNGAESAAVSVSLGSPQSVFTQNEDVIRQQVQSVALQSIRNGVQEASSFMTSARNRFIGGPDVDGSQSVFSGRNSIPVDVEGFASVSTSSANIDGSFFGQFGSFDGTYRRMTSGDFNLQRDENGNTTGALSGRIAWEYLTSDTAMLGWFVGAEYVQSDLNSTFTGDQTSFGASIGGYFVTELQDRLYLDGNLTVKQNEHDLQLTNGTLELESLYQSTSVLSGLTLTGVTTIDESSELWPTFSINAARTDLGTIGFTGTAYGLTDSTLSMDGGLVSYADVSVAPKYRAAMDGQSLANSLLVASVTPKVMCEYTELGGSTTRNCGSGLMLSLLGTTKEGNGTLELELGLDRIGGATRHSVALNADLRY
jgi:hypothetical protein